VKGIFHKHTFLTSSRDVPEGAPFGLILDRTNFYAEAGGQEHDTGNILIDKADGAVDVGEFEVSDVQAYSGYVVHVGRLKGGVFEIGNDVICTYDEVYSSLLSCFFFASIVTSFSQLRRWPIRNNHTGTHILNFCLREVLGDHVDQKGSLVAPTKLRFDFSHKAAIPLSELSKIEQMSVEWIERNVPVYGEPLPLAQAQKISGVRAVFGESYPDPVRVVSLGYDVKEIAADPQNPRWRTTSIEFCGGT
jgi:alanyl-tRNA synthetase